MLRRSAAAALLVIGLSGEAPAGVLSATDAQRMRDYAELVVPADREIPPLRDMAARIAALSAAAAAAGPALGDDAGAEFRSVLQDLPATGGPTLERMVASLRAIRDPDVLAPPEWGAMLAAVAAEIEERLAYDARILKAYQRSATQGTPSLRRSVVGWEDRPDAEAHWTRFKEVLDGARRF